MATYDPKITALLCSVLTCTTIFCAKAESFSRG